MKRKLLTILILVLGLLPISDAACKTVKKTDNTASFPKDPESDSPQPNIVFILADDCSNWDLACYGSSDAITPNIDRLAAQGIRFDRCYQAAPMCSPTRHNIYTGLYPVKSGAYPNHTNAYPGTESIVHYLKPLGYRVALSGKTHIGPQKVFPFEYLGNKKNPDFGLVDDFLKEVKENKEPFALMLCSNEPHTPWDKGDASKYDPARITLPPHYVDTKETRETFCRYLAEINYLDDQVGKAMELLEKHDFSDNTLVVFASEQGNAFPFAKWTCYEAGVKSALIARLPGTIQAGTSSGAIVEYSDLLPTFIDIAGGEIPEKLDGESLVPLFSGEKEKVKDYSYSLQTSRGINNGSPYYGIRAIVNEQYRYIRNLTPEMEFKNATNNNNKGDSKYYQSWLDAAKTDPKAKELVNKYSFRPKEELYDIKNDKWCRNNLADLPEFQDAKNKLSKKLLEWMEECGDKGQQTELEAFERMPKHNKKAKQPNIIVILTDDMGYSDLGCFGGEVETPNLDGLAANGLRFTQFYNGARCCPTRASLISGCYPHQTGIGHMTNTPKSFTHHDLGIPEYRGFLNKNCVTIAEVLKEAGYSTLMTGKWHLGISEKEKWPLQRGFDKFYGIVPGASNFFKPVYPRGITYMNDTISINDEDFYTTDAFTDHAIKFIRESRQENGAQPFFLYLAYTAPHWPIQAPQEVVEKYKGEYLEGWTKLRETRYARMKELGIIDENWELSPQDSRNWDSLSDEKKKEMDLRRAIYSAMIDRMDWNIGKLVDHLKETGILDNTLILFLNDNGACAEFDELGSGPKEELETKEGYVLSYGGAWANASNTPYREYKHWVHEGGIGTPFIVHWPNAIPKKNQGEIISQYGFLPDIMATCVDVARANYPEEYKGNKIVPTSGKSLVPLFKGDNKRIHTEPIFWEHEGNKAVRLGKYKLVSKWNKQRETSWELYDMETDRTEMHDLSAELPEKVNELAGMYQEWAVANNVRPWNEIHAMYKIKRKKDKEKKK